MASKPEGLKPGIYFGLAPEVYHRDPALSRSNLLSLLRCPAEYWHNSWMNPDVVRKVVKPSPDMEYGEAMHMMLFEPDRFHKTYQPVPGSLLDNSRKPIAHESYMAMAQAAAVVKKAPTSSMFLAGGWPEVTIVFEKDGFLFRTRHDYLSVNLTTDYKTTYSLETGKLRWAFAQYGYDIQVALYRWSRIILRQQIKDGTAHVYGKPDSKLFRRFLESEMDGFINIFQTKEAPYPFRVLAASEDTQAAGEDRIAAAMRIYSHNLQEFGTKPWTVSSGEIEEFSMAYGVKSSETL